MNGLDGGEMDEEMRREGREGVRRVCGKKEKGGGGRHLVGQGDHFFGTFIGIAHVASKKLQ